LMSLITKITSNPCSRCGKERVVVKSWNKRVGNSLLTYTLTSCPDPECQKRVSGDLRKEAARRSAQKKEAEMRLKLKKENLVMSKGGM